MQRLILRLNNMNIMKNMVGNTFVYVTIDGLIRQFSLLEIKHQPSLNFYELLMPGLILSEYSRWLLCHEFRFVIDLVVIWLPDYRCGAVVYQEIAKEKKTWDDVQKIIEKYYDRVRIGHVSRMNCSLFPKIDNERLLATRLYTFPQLW